MSNILLLKLKVKYYIKIFNNDDNVPPKPNIIEDIIHDNESDPVEDLDDS